MIVCCPSCGTRYSLDGGKEDLSSEISLRCAQCGEIFRPLAEVPTDSTAPSFSVSRKNRILVADDANYFRRLLKEILTEAGYEVILAVDGEEAVKKLEDESPDMLIVDLQLPKRSGFEVIKGIREGDKGNKIPILAMSSVYTGSDHIVKLIDAGANDFINKDFSPDHLLHRVRKLLPVIK